MIGDLALVDEHGDIVGANGDGFQPVSGRFKGAHHFIWIAPSGESEFLRCGFAGKRSAPKVSGEGADVEYGHQRCGEGNVEHDARNGIWLGAELFSHGKPVVGCAFEGIEVVE